MIGPVLLRPAWGTRLQLHDELAIETLVLPAEQYPEAV
jgi:hypothetical protein